MKFQILLAVSLLPFGCFCETQSPGSKWILQLLQHIQQTTAGTLDVIFVNPGKDTTAVFDQVRIWLDLPKHESTTSLDVRGNLLYLVDGMDDRAKRLAKALQKGQELTYFLIVVDSGITVKLLPSLQGIYCNHLLVLEVLHDLVRIHRVSPADYRQVVLFDVNSSFVEILDDRYDWRGREVGIMYSPNDSPFSITLEGKLTGLDIEMCRAAFERTGIWYRFIERPPITSWDFEKYRSSVLKYQANKTIHLMVSSVVIESSLNTDLTVFDRKGSCLILPRSLQRDVIHHLVHPFEYKVWLLISLILVLDLVLGNLFTRAFPHNLIMILLFGDSLADHQQTRWTRYYCFFCTVLLFLLSEAYLAKAIIYMTVTRYTPDMETLDEVFDSNVQFKLPPGAKQAYQQHGSVFGRLMERSIEDPEFRYDMADDQYGYLVSCRYGEYLIERHIRQEILDLGQRDAKRRFYMLDQMLNWEFRRYVVAKYFTYYPRLKKAFNSLFEVGLWNHWLAMFRHDWGYDGFNYHMWDEDEILSLEDIVALWYLMAVGLVVSTLVLLVEVVWSKVTKKRVLNRSK